MGRTKKEVCLEPREIQLRAYTIADSSTTGTDNSIKPSLSRRTLIFDTETTVDPAQRLRFGTYQLRHEGELVEEGIFFDQEALTAADIGVLRAVARRRAIAVEHTFLLRSVRDFVEEVLFEECAKLNGTCVGFNLPFDLSRLAIVHGTAKSTAKYRKFQHGFSLQLSADEYRPRVRIKHVSHRASFIEFVISKEGLNASKRRIAAGISRRPPGVFVDVKTLAGVLLAESHSLDSLSKALRINSPKQAADKHGQALTPEYVAYCLTDVQATWECYAELSERLEGHRLPDAGAHELISEASLGKTYLRAMNVRPWKEVQPDFPPELTGQIMSAYFGGRSEVHIRRQVCQAFYCDFLSMYPTVNALMGLWQFVIAEGVDYRDVTRDARSILDTWTPSHLQDRANWHRLAVLVEVEPDDDVFPVRAVYGDAYPRHQANKMANIALNRLTCEAPLWFTLADCLASKFLSGKTPQIRRAVGFTPRQAQAELNSVAIAGDPAFVVDPIKLDFFKALIDRRRTVKAKAKRASADAATKGQLKTQDLALKILANSTSYGIFVETRVDDLDEKQTINRFGFDGIKTPIKSKVQETPGEFFHPLVGTLITGAARLMLALSERKALDEGLEWIFCDTDGIAFAKPETMSVAEFYAAGTRVCEWFKPLNPYQTLPGSSGPESILKMEDENFEANPDGSLGALRPLYAYAVSAKRYALFNQGPNGDVILRKASAHGLGHLLPPYRKPKGSDWEQTSKAAYWQEQIWTRICEAALKGQDDHLDFSDPRLAVPAASRYGANSSTQMHWFDDYNADRPYQEQVRPFNFLLTYKAKNMEILSAHDDRAAIWRRDHKAPSRPASIYDDDANLASKHAFDRGTREPIPASWLKTYAEDLVRYHLHDEAKFLGGTDARRGILQRRHINVIAVRHIGKEAHNWEEDYFLGADGENDVEFDGGIINPAKVIEDIRQGVDVHGIRAIVNAAGISQNTLTVILKPGTTAKREPIVRAARAVFVLDLEHGQTASENIAALETLKELVDAHGLVQVAQEFEVDPSNLGKMLSEKRGLPGHIAKRLLK